ncbi:hypothetical protein [Gloeocapsopsis dulcis]|uniref:Uncharacterized protein n=1 Tax=Gloeocapsopsis dulcis AAB1 = 1H9 TaxID=1433147 RepID=A0A6N8FU00_9CHRO|nr:hypothetical protein [Gloeocapsopsis dulcis]MUL36588.1 hypothetical protein [Gloeocapsopsis dulcis AAB1 = 1H9]WNN87213.1 hypothetical protein P0S91_12765 [Gloeocapsopsis dulcis]
MWREKIGGILGFVLIFGGIFFFRGCGDIIQVYDPVTMKRENWSPFREIMADRSPKRETQAKLVEGFYKVFPEKKKSPQTNQDVLDMADKYCELKTSVTKEEQIFASIASQLQRLLEEPSAISIVDELSLNLVTVYALANLYSCPDKGVQVSIPLEAPKSYLSDIRQQGFDTQNVNAEFHQKPDATMLVAGYGACSEIYALGYKQAVEDKIKSFSNTQNTNVIYNGAHKYLCPNAK